VVTLVSRAGLLVGCATLLHACREPTQVTLLLTTDASCTADGFQGLAVAVASQAALPRSAPIARSKRCEPGDLQASLGSIVVVPSENDDDAFAVRVVAGIGVPVESCTAPDYVLGPDDTAAGRGCIVARRSLSFLPNTKLELPILLRQTCLNVPCEVGNTCVDGHCVDATVDVDKCAEEGSCAEDDLVGGASSVGGAGGSGGVGVGGAGMGGTSAGGSGAGGSGAAGTGGTGASGTGAGGTGAGGTGAGGTGGTGAAGTGAGGTGAGGTGGTGASGAGGTGAGGTGACGTGGA